MSELAQFLLNGVFLGAIYGLLAMPMSLVWTTTDVVDVATGGYAVAAGLVAAAVGFPLGVPAGILTATALGVLGGGIFLLFQAVKGGRDSILMVLGTFGFLLVIEAALLVSIGTAGQYLPQLGGVVRLGGVGVAVQNLINLAITVVVLAGLVLLLTRTTTGLSMRASAISVAASKLSGIAVRSHQFFTMVLGATIAGVAGVLAVMTIGLSYSSGFPLTVAAFSGAVVFGLKGPATAFAGGVCIGVAEAVSQGYLPSGWAAAVPSLIIVLVLAGGRLPQTAFAGSRP